MQINWKHIVLFTFVTITAIVYAYLYYKPEPIVFDDHLLREIQNNLEMENKSLQDQVEQLATTNDKKEKLIDSLQSLKPKIKYVYIQKSNEIDSASVGTLINEFAHIFATSHIK